MAPTGSDRLRQKIDRGETGDKVDFPDPAAAPLGTDDEAAGAAPAKISPEAEVREVPRPNDTGERGRAHWETPHRDRWTGPTLALLGILVVVGVVVALVE